MEAGARGASFGIMYRPELLMAHRNITMRCCPVALRDGLPVRISAAKGTVLVESVREVIGIVRAAPGPPEYQSF